MKPANCRFCIKRTVVRGLLGLWAVLLLSGCTPEEKTVVLPGEETQAAGGEEDWDEEGFAVEKIYTFSYETSAALEQSAFLKDCGENEIRVIAREEDGGTLVCRAVDYRYGFYQTEGEFLQLWEDWAKGEEEQREEDLYIGKMLPAPDGKQILAYSFSSFGDYSTVKLYQLGVREPWLLYEGTGGVGRWSKGSFTSDGRWVTFDASGFSMEEGTVVFVYDCLKAHDQQKIVLDDSAQLYPPDLVLQNWIHEYAQFWEVRLDNPFGEVGRTGIDRSSDGRLLFVEDFPGNQNCQYLAGGVGTSMAYLQYELAAEEERLYYLAEDSQLWNMDLVQGTFGAPIVFNEKVLDFLRLETGDILVLAVPNPGEAGMGSGDYAVNSDPLREADSRLMMIQKFWGIRSVDLYMYPAEGGQGELLYKGVQDLVSMEYDPENGRILLETWEEREPGRRKCLILKLR